MATTSDVFSCPRCPTPPRELVRMESVLLFFQRGHQGWEKGSRWDLEPCPSPCGAPLPVPY